MWGCEQSNWAKAGERMSLEQLQRLIRSFHIILLSNGSLWAGSTHIPVEIKRAALYYRRELLWRIRAHHWDVCPARDAHRKEVYYCNGEWICGACERLGIVA